MPENQYYALLFIACLLLAYPLYRYLCGGKKTQVKTSTKAKAEPSQEDLVTAQETADAERKLQAQQQADEAERQLETDRQREIDRQEFLSAKALCEENEINIFDWLAAQTQEDRIRFAAYVSADDIRRYWRSKSPLKLWDNGYLQRDCPLVRLGTCNSPDEWTDIFALVGKSWFTRGALNAYVDAAPNSVILFDRYRECGYTIAWKDNFPRMLRAELDTVDSLEYIDKMKTVIEEIMKAKAESEYPGHDHDHFVVQENRKTKLKISLMKSLAEAKMRIIEAQLKTVDSLARAADLAWHANSVDTWVFDDLDAEYQRCAALTILAVNKALAFCLDPDDIANFKHFVYQSYCGPRESMLIDGWFQSKMDACSTMAELSAFYDSMNDKQREEYAEMANRRSVQIRLTPK